MHDYLHIEFPLVAQVFDTGNPYQPPFPAVPPLPLIMGAAADVLEDVRRTQFRELIKHHTLQVITTNEVCLVRDI